MSGRAPVCFCRLVAAFEPRFDQGMSDPTPGCDPSEAYEVVPLDQIRKACDCAKFFEPLG
jgi:hypothetical protein